MKRWLAGPTAVLMLIGVANAEIVTYTVSGHFQKRVSGFFILTQTHNSALSTGTLGPPVSETGTLELIGDWDGVYSTTTNPPTGRHRANHVHAMADLGTYAFEFSIPVDFVRPFIFHDPFIPEPVIQPAPPYYPTPSHESPIFGFWPGSTYAPGCQPPCVWMWNPYIEDAIKVDGISHVVHPVPEFSSVVGRHVFYDGSAFDGDGDGDGDGDDAAIATDKSALLPGESATFENCTSFDGGINGIIIDLQDAINAEDISLDDFEFRVGNDEAPGAWDITPMPSVTVRPGEGADSSDRIVLVWPNGSIENGWLEVTLKAGETTRLLEDDVFYFGSAVGETGNTGNDLLVNASDMIAVSDNTRGEYNPADITDPYDFNRDSLVDVVDLVIARNAATGLLTALRLIDLSAMPVASVPAASAPVPEPCAFTLTAFGLLGLLVFGRCRR